MHADGAFAGEDAGNVGHHRGLVQGRLAVDQEDVAVAQVAQDFLVGTLSDGVVAA